MNTIVHTHKPKDFAPKVEVVAVYVQHGGKILLMKLSSHKPESGLWGVPAGKLEKDEAPSHGAKRELFEETGIAIESQEAFQSLGELYMRKPDMDYVYHLFRLQLSHIPDLLLSEEHCAYTWATEEEAKKLPLMQGADRALELYYNFK